MRAIHRGDDLFRRHIFRRALEDGAEYRSLMRRKVNGLAGAAYGVAGEQHAVDWGKLIAAWADVHAALRAADSINTSGDT